MDATTASTSSGAQPHPGSALEVLRVSTRLGVTSFGGPIAHLGYFHAEYVARRRWLDEQTYADLVALCQFLPGPASSQVGIAVGIFRAGLLGGLAAWLGFTLPSALALVAFAYGLQALGGTDAGWLHGLKIVAVAVVAQAVCPKDGNPMVLKKGRFGPFLACTRYPECKETKRLVRGEGGKLQVEVLAPIEEKCPACGNDLMWRRGRFGAFIACSNYPTCKYIKKKEAREIGLLCPDCGQGQVVERKGRWGRFFYGCRRYPECKFTAYHKPIPEPCPDCGRPYLLEKETKKEGKVVFCGNEACHYKREAA